MAECQKCEELRPTAYIQEGANMVPVNQTIKARAAKTTGLPEGTLACGACRAVASRGKARLASTDASKGSWPGQQAEAKDGGPKEGAGEGKRRRFQEPEGTTPLRLPLDAK